MMTDYNRENERSIIYLYCNEFAYDQIGPMFNLVTEELFEDPSHRLIYIAAKNVRSRGLTPDIALMGKELMPHRKQFSNILNTAANCLTMGASSTNGNALIMQLFERYAANTLRNELHNSVATFEEYDFIDNMERLRGTIDKIESLIHGAQSSETTESLVDKTINAIIKQHQEQVKVIGLSTGLRCLDDRTMGLVPGLVYVIGARPGMGKTSLVKKIALQNCIHDKKKVLVVSGEETEQQLITGLLSMMTQIDSSKIRKGQCSSGELNELRDAAKKIRNNLIIEAKGALTWQKVERLVKLHKPDITVVDYLQIFSNEASDGKNLTGDARLSIICNNLARVAKENLTAMIELSQLSREVEKRQPPRPILSDMKDSGAIEANAVQVWLMYRPDYYGVTSDKNGNDIRNICEINIAKNRYGSIGKEKVTFIPQYTSFEDREETNTPSEGNSGIVVNNKPPSF